MTEAKDEWEWVVYRGHIPSRYFTRAASASAWDCFVEREMNVNGEVNLTLLARGLTQEQAEAMVRLTD